MSQSPEVPQYTPCVIQRFRNNPESADWVIDGRYFCDAPTVKPGSGVVGACGRVIVPMIAEDGRKDIEPDPHSPQCARSVGKQAVAVMTKIVSPLFCDVPEVIVRHV